MRKLGVLIGSVVLALMAGCGPVDEQSSAEAIAAAEAQAQVQLGLADACQQNNNGACVAAGYGACTGWSATVDCGATTCDYEYGLSPCYTRVCIEGTCENVPDGATFTSVQSYRVCSNPLGQTCTEWKVLSDYRRVKCGC